MKPFLTLLLTCLALASTHAQSRITSLTYHRYLPGEPKLSWRTYDSNQRLNWEHGQPVGEVSLTFTTKTNWAYWVECEFDFIPLYCVIDPWSITCYGNGWLRVSTNQAGHNGSMTFSHGVITETAFYRIGSVRLQP